MSKIAIKVENISKQYRLGEVSTGTISHDLNRWWAKIRGKEDPFLKIGESNDRTLKGTSNYVWSLKDINFEINQGDAVGIIGRNGAGKSTLLKLLSKVTAPTTGVIKTRGRIASLLEVGTGFHPELSGRENIYLNGAILGMSKSEIKRKFDEIVDFAGVERYIDTPVKRYSSGMYVRLAFAVAAHLESEILIVDEVLAVGDAEFQKKCLGKMGDLSKGQGRTVLFVSHNMASVRNLCNKGVLLKNGTISNLGNIDSIVECYLSNLQERTNSDLSLILDRAGDGLLRFLKIKFFDDNGLSKNVFQVGENINIEISFSCKELFYNMSNSKIDIGINNLMGDRITWLSSSIYCDKIKYNSNNVIFQLKRVLLVEGTYNVNLFSDTNMGISDWLTNVAKFQVVMSDFFQTGKQYPPAQGFVVTDFIIKH